MYPKQLTILLTDMERWHEEEWQAMLRRPDAPPLSPEEPAIDVGARLAATIRGWMQRLPAEAIPPARIWIPDEEVRRPG